MAKNPAAKSLAPGDIVKARASSPERIVIGQVAEIVGEMAFIVPACTVIAAADGPPTMNVAQTHGPFPFPAASVEPI